MAIRSGGFGKKALRQGNPAYTVRWRANSLIRLTDAVTGAFLGGQFTRVLGDIHADAAHKVQEGMVEELKRKVIETGRHQRGTKALEESLLDEDNAVATANGFNALLPRYMDGSPAKKYWRRIEFGDTKTFNSFILFTNDMEGGPRYGPWSPKGSPTGYSGTSANRSRRSGNNNLYSRKEPEGYKHMRMPQHKGPYVFNIGPYPDYQFSKGGARVFNNYPFAAQYKTKLAAIGIDMSTQLR